MRHIYNILQSIFAIAIIGTMSLGLTACDNIDEVPPIKESTTNKVYKIPDPTPMTSSDIATYNEIRAEYQQGTSVSE